jgi:hypothetical protein
MEIFTTFKQISKVLVKQIELNLFYFYLVANNDLKIFSKQCYFKLNKKSIIVN